MFTNEDIVGTSTAVVGRMSNSTTLPSIDTPVLSEVTGGALIRAATGLGTNSSLLAAQLPLQLAQAQLVQNQKPDWTPLMFAALAMRG